MGNKVDEILSNVSTFDKPTKKKYRETHNVSYSIPKVGLARRTLGIPNPIHQIELSDIIIENGSNPSRR